ncbi:MAG: phosphate ABC transporter substrate-binding protein PstS [Timaviella obliquedivisa GSE-PSE-MK23-08B]|jgi:phosphate transport system substrate-binding protein|nr:phosphate ABC transporter substrate-binding protein PstS [Timaviella obliquedivisa GSE-PSE-MK23-08B]
MISNRLKRRVFLASLAVVSLGFAACQSTTSEAPSATGGSPATSGAAGGTVASASLNGAGATFPAPVYQRWFAEYNKVQPGVQVSYQSVGSGAGVEQYLAGTVDFGASDEPLKDDEIAQFKTKYGADPIQVPMTAGSVVFAYNLPTVKDLKLSREAYCGIATGEITNWNDPTIAAANPGTTLPDRPISFVYRSDGSGTTAVFTTHLDAACPNWKAGGAKTVEWSVGTGAKGNEGVTAQVQQAEGSVGYVEYAYAKENGISMAAIENKSGAIIVPSPEAGALAFDGEEIPADLALKVPDSANPGAYPITSLTWLLVYPTYQDAAKKEALTSVIDWALTDGTQYSNELGYIPLPAGVKGKVTEAVTKIQVK